MTSEKVSRKDKNQNIQVFVRLRPLNQREKDIKSLGVVEVVNNREVVVRQSQQTSHTKKFTFDRAFGPNVHQVEVYQDVVSPLIEEVLAGYNCTVFAYGQTGTGKTHTMVGEHTGDSTTWQSDPLAGIIPRALSQLFDELRISNTEYTVRVSYLELYNEELFDLLSSSEDNSKLRIYEDVTRKGSNIVNGLEEITVYNKSEVYKIMAQGQERKRVASTLMNAQSSRSHTVFTIVVHMKENSPEGEELVKIGKLNLVDLAGSENISKAGSDCPARRERARECVNINQSLLTLGRVITALVERHPHIPYRESKLTRILQESLGGRTKTSIIATVSPGHKDLEETMSTLEYAHRAKNIQNKPEINQKMTKKAILKEYAEEIDRLKRDLQAARDKNGVYLASETFTEMTIKQEEQKKEIQELLLQKRAMEEERDKASNVFTDLRSQLRAKEAALSETARSLGETRGKLQSTKEMLKSSMTEAEEQRHLAEQQAAAARALAAHSRQLRSAAAAAAAHAGVLRDAVDRRRDVESTNLQVTQKFRQESSEQRTNIANEVESFTEELKSALNALCEAGDSHSKDSMQYQEQNKKTIEELVQKIELVLTELKSSSELTESELQDHIASTQTELTHSLTQRGTELEQLLCGAVAAVGGAVGQGTNIAAKGREGIQLFIQEWWTSSSSQIASLRARHADLLSSARAAARRRGGVQQEQAAARRRHQRRREQKLQDSLTEINEERTLIEQRLEKQLADLNTERDEMEDRLAKWEEEERRMFEERIAKHLREQREIADERAAKKRADVEEERRLLEERVQRRIKMNSEQLALVREDEASEEAAEQARGRGAREAGEWLDNYSKEFDQGTSAISLELESFSGGALERMDAVTEELLKTLRQEAARVENEAAVLLKSERAAARRLAGAARRALAQLAAAANNNLHTFLQAAETTNTATINQLSTISEASSALASSESALQSAVLGLAGRAGSALGGLRGSVRAGLAELGRLEELRLQRGYSVYMPTGSTPARQQYPLPSPLSALSPHERILARFRAARAAAADDEDCVVVDVEPEGHPESCPEPRPESCPEPRPERSDSESSLSEDSSVFVAPSPPEPKDNKHQIVKCTSETDIYMLRKQRGKENQIQQQTRPGSCSKRPPPASRLPAPAPAPASHKKPLAARNDAS